MTKADVVRWFVAWTNGWNQEFHNAIQARVMSEYKRLFPDGHGSLDLTAQRIEEMQSFYSAGMVATATMLIAGVSVIVACWHFLCRCWH
jgi:hypothetical protein